MKRLKLFPKIFLYTLGIMAFIVIVSHGLIYLLAPRMEIVLTSTEQVKETILVSVREETFVTKAVARALPISLTCSLLISALCSFLLARGIVSPIQTISASSERMMNLDKGARCAVYSKDEIGLLARNINKLYANLLSTIEDLEQEKDTVRDMERAKVDFLRAASHELKTPVTALNATLENMILGVGKYRDYDTYLPECKEMVERLSEMIQEILETSRLNVTLEEGTTFNLSDFVADLCQPYKMIAAAHQVSFVTGLPIECVVTLPASSFGKVVSNLLANAVTYTEAGKRVQVYIHGRDLVIENECTPIPGNEIHRLFEPFYRPDFSRSRDSGGNGLGLYIVDTLLTAMNISYSFAPMKSPDGMKFTIYL